MSHVTSPDGKYPLRKPISVISVLPSGFNVSLDCGHSVWQRHRSHKGQLQCIQCIPQWTQLYTKCTVCEKTDYPHESGGCCRLCNSRRKKPPGDYSNYSRNRVYSVDDFVFDEWNEKSAYLLGVLYAEGHITTSKKSYRVALALSSKDRGWLELLAAAFDFKGRIGTFEIVDEWSPRSAVRFGFTSKRIHSLLVEWGIKQHRMPPVPDAVFHHFTRGFFDGDGSVFTDTHGNCLKANFVGRHDLIFDLKHRLHLLAGTSNRMRVHPKPNSKLAFSVCYGAADTKRLHDFMYQNATLFLSRKKARFQGE